MEKQIEFWPAPENTAVSDVTNVSTVPQRSPFRYPGGKTWLVPLARKWLASLSPAPDILVEAFAGGASIGLAAAFEGLAKRVSLVEIDPQVAVVWQAILWGEGEWLAQRILSFRFTPEAVAEVLGSHATDLREGSFRTIVKNRVSHAGILAPGSSLTKQGENGKGLGQRWYPETLARRIRAISGIRDKFSITCGHWADVVCQHSEDPRAAFFIDPPYTAGCGKRAGSRLYTYCEVDHEEVFSAARRVRGSVLMTYDDDPDVRDLAARHSLSVSEVYMQNAHLAKTRELLIGRDLCWVTT